MSINVVTLVGRLTKDPELRYAQSGTPIARFTLAVNRNRKVEGQPEADFISCIAFSKTAENLANFMKKGSQIGVVGRIQTGSYEGQEGQRIYTTDVVADNIQFLESRGEGGNAPQTNTGGQQQQSYQQQNPPQQQQHQQQPPQNYTRVDEDPFANSKGPIDINPDDLPF